MPLPVMRRFQSTSSETPTRTFFGSQPRKLQVPPNGQPILLLNDHPTTGGYPVIAVVATADLPHAGQLRPGDNVRFSF